MTARSADLGPWLALAGLGLFHGLNPAMGWLFAVALGLQRQSRGVLLLSLVPIALGHAAAVALVVAAVLGLGRKVDPTLLARLAGAGLLAWAAWLAVGRHRHRVRAGMRVGLAGLAAWSFLMASAHGAGFMLVPALLPLCLPAAGAPVEASPLAAALAALGVHTLAQLATIAVISLVVYDRVGLAFLRRGWVNFDWLWIALLATSGAFLLLR